MITTYDQANKLKELGFREPTRAYYIDGSVDYNNPINWNTNEGLDEEGNEQEEDEYCSAPTIPKALQWIRENYSKRILFDIRVSQSTHKIDYCFYVYEYIESLGTYEQIKHGFFDTHPIAESALLDAVLDYLIEKKDE